MQTRGIRQQRTGRHGDQVQLNSPQGVQYKRNIQHVKQFVTPATEPREPSLTEPVKVPCEQMCGQEPTSSPKMGASAGPVEDQSPIQQQLLLWRSGRVTRPAERFSDRLTMSPPNGVCGFQVTLTLIVPYLLFLYLPDRTLLTLLMLFC